MPIHANEEFVEFTPGGHEEKPRGDTKTIYRFGRESVAAAAAADDDDDEIDSIAMWGV